MDFYQNLIRPFFFAFDPEWIHSRVINYLSLVSVIKPLNDLVYKVLGYQNQKLERKLFGLTFPNPIGLSAGFDKNIEAPLAYSAFDFGFAELGSVTYRPQPGNSKPRLWRLIEDKGLVVYYGLNNPGAKVARTRLEKAQSKSWKRSPIGISIARSTAIPEAETTRDYFESFKLLAPVADYVTINVSCPNVVGYTELQNKKFLNSVLETVQNYNQQKTKKPIFVKVGSDDLDKLEQSVKVMIKYDVDAVIISNLLKGKRPKLKSHNLDKPGGISGKPLESQANKVISLIAQKYGQKIKIIGVGGVFNAVDAKKKLDLGASLVQLITGFVYGGPLTIRRINQELTTML